MAKLDENILTVLRAGKRKLNESQADSPTRVHPEKGEDVSGGAKDGKSKIDATKPIKGGAAETLKTTPGDTTGGPTGHIPQNADLPVGQLKGLDSSNKEPGKAKYSLHEEEDKDDEKKVEEEKKELPPFMKKGHKEPDEDNKGGKSDNDEDNKKDKKVVKEEDEKDEKEIKEEDEKEEKPVKEEKEKLDSKSDAPGKSGAEANDRAGYTKKMHGDGEKFNEEDEKDEAEDKKVVKEATSELFTGETISEALKVKMSSIFEETLSSRIKSYRKKLKDQANVQLNERVEEIREQLSEKVESHLDLVAENWVKANELPLETALKAELTEEFICGLKSLFEQHYIDIPQDKVDVVAGLAEKVSELEGKLNEQLEVTAQLNSKNKELIRGGIFEEVSRGMVSTQVDKLKNLSESVKFENADQYKASLSTLKESLSKPVATKAKADLADQTLKESTGSEKKSGSQMVNQVNEALARTSGKR